MNQAADELTKLAEEYVPEVGPAAEIRGPANRVRDDGMEATRC